MEFEEFDRLEKYINNQLTEADKEVLEDELKNDPLLQEKLDQLKNASEATESYGLKLKLNQIHSDLYPENQKTNSRKFYYYAAAACIFLVTIGWWFSSSVQSSDELYSKHFEIYPDYVSSRTVDTNEIKAAFEYYNTGKFQKAASEFEKLHQNNSQNIDVPFYLGLSHLNDNQTNNAIKYLTDVVANNDKYRQQARWFLALAYLKGSQLTEAKAILKNIKAADFRFQEAQQLISEINHLLN